MYFLSDENREQTNFEAMLRQGEKTSNFPILNGKKFVESDVSVKNQTENHAM